VLNPSQDAPRANATEETVSVKAATLVVEDIVPEHIELIQDRMPTPQPVTAKVRGNLSVHNYWSGLEDIKEPTKRTKRKRKRKKQKRHAGEPDGSRPVKDDGPENKEPEAPEHTVQQKRGNDAEATSPEEGRSGSKNPGKAKKKQRRSATVSVCRCYTIICVSVCVWRLDVVLGREWAFMMPKSAATGVNPDSK
jgi:hypothetical protein